MSRLLKLAAFILGVIFVINVFGPRPTVDWTITFNADELGDDVDAYLAGRESNYDDIIEGAQKEVIWAGATGAKTPISLVYIHGFSATKQEIRPVPDKVAAALGANLYFTRMTGHGRGSAAMAQATANDWLNDVAETVAIGRAIGERVVVIATSQGGTMTAMSAVDLEVMRDVAGIVFVSPNFGIVSASAALLTAPFAETFVPWITGAERSWTAHNPEQEKWWTTRYPTQAVFPMAASVRAAVGLAFEDVITPAFFIYSPEDAVVKASQIRRVANEWGGKKEIWEVELGAEDDPSSHVIAGDILSPSMTDPMAERIIAWVGGL